MPKHKFTPADAVKGGRSSVRLKRQAIKLQRDLAAIGLTSDVLADVKDILVEIIKASQANPLIGIVVALVTANVLKRVGVIDAAVEEDILIIVSAAGAVNLATALKDLVFGGASAIDLVKPTPTTLTHAETDQQAGPAAPSPGETGAALSLITKLASKAAVAAA